MTEWEFVHRVHLQLLFGVFREQMSPLGCGKFSDSDYTDFVALLYRRSTTRRSTAFLV